VIVTAAIGDQIGNRADFHAVQLGEFHEVGQPRHRAIIVHDLADDAGRIKAGQPRNIDRSFRVTGAHENAALARNQRKHVPGHHDVLWPLGRIDRNRNRTRPVMRRDAGGYTFLRLDRNREGRAMRCAVLRGHHRQVQRLGPVMRQRQANQTARVLGHEVDDFRRRHLRWDNDVAFVLPLFGVDENEHAPVARVLDDLLGRREKVVEFALHANSFSRAR
jgi:hypothetical protein